MTDRKINVQMSEAQYHIYKIHLWERLRQRVMGVVPDVTSPPDRTNDDRMLCIIAKIQEQEKEVQIRRKLYAEFEEFLAMGDEPEPQSPLEVIHDGYRVLSADEIMQDGDELKWLDELEPVNPGYFGKQAKMFMPGAVVIRKKPEPTAEPAPKSSRPEDNIPEGWKRIDNDLPSVSEKWWNYLYKKFEAGPCETSRQFVIRRKEGA